MIYNDLQMSQIITLIHTTRNISKTDVIRCLNSAGRTGLSRHSANCWLNPSNVWLLRLLRRANRKTSAEMGATGPKNTPMWFQIDFSSTILSEFLVFSIQPLRVRLDKLNKFSTFKPVLDLNKNRRGGGSLSCPGIPSKSSSLWSIVSS